MLSWVEHEKGLITSGLVLMLPKKNTHTFCGFSMGSNQYCGGRVHDLCVYLMTGTTQGSIESGFMEKPGIKPPTPGLQDIGLSPTPWRLPKEAKKNAGEERQYIIDIEVEDKYITKTF